MRKIRNFTFNSIKFPNLIISLCEIISLDNKIVLVYSLCFSHGFPGCSEKTKLTAANGGVRSRGLVSRVNRNEQTDWCLLAGTIFFTSAQGMYQNIFAYYSTTRVNRKIWVNGSLFDDWYNLHEFCTSRVSNWNLHTRLHTYKLISLEAPHSAEQVFFYRFLFCLRNACTNRWLNFRDRK